MGFGDSDSEGMSAMSTPADDDALGVATQEPIVTTRTDQREKESTRRKRQPPYSVVVHNDDLHTFDYVIEVLRRVCGHDEVKAWLLTAQIHFTGRAHVWTGTLELAELKRDQIRGFGPDIHAARPVEFPLGVTLEPLPGD